MISALVAVATALALASFVVRPNKARAFDLFYGTMIINDDTAPVSIDLASGKPTVRLAGASARVGTDIQKNLAAVPLQGGTLLLNSVTGEFNMIDQTGFVIKTDGRGIGLPTTAGSDAAIGVAAGNSAYILKVGGPTTDVYLVNQSTVSTATGKTRAYGTIEAPVDSAPGSTVGANGDLWLLTGASSGSRSIQQLTVPAGTNAGATLTNTGHGSVGGVAALGVATRSADGSGGDVVAVATPDAIQVFDGSASPRQVAVSVPDGTDQILPTSNQQGRLDFLFHAPTGWTRVSTSTSGGGASIAALPGLAPGTGLVAPAQSEGTDYTMTVGGDPELWQIAANGTLSPVPGAARYPVKSGEPAKPTGTEIQARGSRVIFNQRAYLQSLTVFADGSHAPVVIDKSTVAQVSSSGGAAALAAQRETGTGKPAPSTQTPGTPKPKPAQQVNDKIDCKTTDQIPNIPVLQLLQRGSRSVQLQWSYPQLSQDQCYPSTYTVQARALTSTAPAAPEPVQVQGQTGVNLAGLFPNTDYSIVVTAYINKQSTPSLPLKVQTTDEGPPAPTSVVTTVDAKGNWLVTWNSCGGLTKDCVASSAWRLTAQTCGDAPGLISPPAIAQVAGDPSQHSFSKLIPGSAALLGHGLSFTVEGVGVKGTIGDPKSDGHCAVSWSAPIKQNIHLAASTPPSTAGAATSTTATVTFTGDADVAKGGYGGQLTYTLLGPDGPVTSVGPTTATSAELSGVLPGRSYTVQVTVAPPGHPDAATTLQVPVEPAVATWPTLSVKASYADAGLLNGTVTYQIGGLASRDADGETFDLINSTFSCGNGNSAQNLGDTNFDPAKQTFTVSVNRLFNYGQCTVTVQLQQNPDTVTNPAYFGSTPSGTASGAVAVNPPLQSGRSEFTARWVASPQAQVSVDTTRGDGAWALSNKWVVTVLDPDGAGCGTTNGPGLGAPNFPLTIPVDPSCIAKLGTDGWTVSITYKYLGSSNSAQPKVEGNAPQPVALKASDFTATWQAATDPDGNATMSLKYKGSADLGSQTSNWSEVVFNPANKSCSDDAATRPTASGIEITVSKSCLTATPATGWTVQISYTDATAGPYPAFNVTISGTPPAP